jgi:hypothetical protein
LVEEVSPPDKIFEAVESLLLRIRKNSSSSIRETKKLIAACLKDPNLLSVHDKALPLVDSAKTEDFKKTTQVFLEKRDKN